MELSAIYVFRNAPALAASLLPPYARAAACGRCEAPAAPPRFASFAIVFRGQHAYFDPGHLRPPTLLSDIVELEALGEPHTSSMRNATESDANLSVLISSIPSTTVGSDDPRAEVKLVGNVRYVETRSMDNRFEKTFDGTETPFGPGPSPCSVSWGRSCASVSTQGPTL
jgi:hypothetical protein